MNEEELGGIVPILMKSTNESLSEKEIEKVYELYVNYFNRLDKEGASAYLDFYSDILEVPAEYNYEFNQCLFNSFKLKKPTISREFEDLKGKMEMFGFADSAKLINDIDIIRAAGNNTNWVDAFGQEQGPFTQEVILRKISDSEIMLKNFKRLSEKFKENI